MTRRPAPSESELPRMLRAWLGDEVASLPDGPRLPREIADSISERLDGIPQRRHRWLGRWLDRGGAAMRSGDRHGWDAHGRRTLLMFGSTIAAGVTALAVGITLLVPVSAPAPGGGGGVAPPAASSPSASPQAAWAAVFGTASCAPSSVGTAVEHFDSPPYGVSGGLMDCRDWVSDPRVSGTGTMGYNLVTLDERSREAGFSTIFNGSTWGDRRIDGPDGSWTGRVYGVYDDRGAFHLVGILAGDGAYDGLIYAFQGSADPGAPALVMTGVIQPGTPPPDGSGSPAP